MIYMPNVEAMHLEPEAEALLIELRDDLQNGSRIHVVLLLNDFLDAERCALADRELGLLSRLIAFPSKDPYMISLMP